MENKGLSKELINRLKHSAEPLVEFLKENFGDTAKTVVKTDGTVDLKFKV